jgi:sucrose-6-phosphate hydrolase SacC (GH32 family)
VCDEPVLACGPEAYDRHGVAFDQIVSFRGRYYAYYHASPAADRSTWQTCVATSTDLVHWEKWAGNPLLPVDPEHPKRSSATLVHDGERHRLYTTHPDVRVRFSVSRVPVPAKTSAAAGRTSPR